MSDKLGLGKFQPMWLGPYIFKQVLAKGAFELVDFGGTPLAQPRNGLYLKNIMLDLKYSFTVYILSIVVLSVSAVCLFIVSHDFYSSPFTFGL